MKEIINHKAYKLVKEFFDKGLALDYIILEDDEKNIDSYEKHKKAAIEGMSILKNRCHELNIKYDENNLKGEEYSVESFFSVPNNPFYLNELEGSNCKLKIDKDAEYTYAFLEPPYGNKCNLKDWADLNDSLFSNKDNLKIYKWNTNWSTYFNAGLEWWGAFYWTIYDKNSDIYIVVAGSTTD